MGGNEGEEERFVETLKTEMGLGGRGGGRGGNKGEVEMFVDTLKTEVGWGGIEGGRGWRGQAGRAEKGAVGETGEGCGVRWRGGEVWWGRGCRRKVGGGADGGRA